MLARPRAARRVCFGARRHGIGLVQFGLSVHQLGVRRGRSADSLAAATLAAATTATATRRGLELLGRSLHKLGCRLRQLGCSLEQGGSRERLSGSCQ